MTELAKLIKRGAVRLVHWSTMPVLSVRSVPQENPRDAILHHTKPRGLWLSDEAAEMSWSEWCNSESFGRGVLEHRVELAPSANILHIQSVDELDAFAKKYGVFPEHQHFRDEPAIQWAAVASDYDGILITPYQWQRLHSGSSWYYGWDCASGCIWHKRAVANIEPVKSLREAAADLEQFLERSP